MRFFKVLKMVLFVVLASAVLGFVVEHLWNWLMPQLVGAHTVTYWQALGLFVLGKLLFGGFHRGGGGGRRGRGWKRGMEERFARMSPEEREQFRAGVRGRCGWGPADKERFREEVRSRWGRGARSGDQGDITAKETV